MNHLEQGSSAMLPAGLRGPWTLLKKELLRFWRVAFQTVAAPVITALLYLLIFSHVLESHVQVYDGVPYTAFLIPGLIMMSVLQNAFANSSSSLIQLPQLFVVWWSGSVFIWWQCGLLI